MDTRKPKPKLNILVVEDDRNLRESMLDALTSSGHRVDGIACAEHLPTAAELQKLDCVILDLSLPSVDGIEIAKRLRRGHPDLGIVMFTARSRNEDRRMGYESGADIYLTKPATLDVLVQAVAALSRRLIKVPPNRSAEPVLRLDPKSLLLRCKGANVSVTQSEAALLTAFANATQQTLGTQEVASVLGHDLTALKKTLVELHVSRLRKKIPHNADVANPIRAVRGVGYQLCVSIEVEA